MLLNPKWNDAKTDVFTLASLIAWLEQQPPDREYNFFCDTGQCLLDQYLAARGLTGFGDAKRSPDIADYLLASSHYIRACYLDLPHSECIGHEIAHGMPMTFGAALARARKFAEAA